MKSGLRPVIGGCLLLFVAAASGEAADGTTITMGEVVPFAEDSSGAMDIFSPAGGAKRRVESECDLGRALSESIASEAKSKRIQIVRIPEVEAAAGKVLLMKIEGAAGQLGGPWTGTKSVTVRGELREGDTLVGSFVAREETTPFFAGTCRAFTHCVERIATDIVKWLRRPTVKARLGSA